MNSLEFLKRTRPQEFAMRERLMAVCEKGNPEGLPWFQSDTDRFMKADGEGSDKQYTWIISTPTVDRMGDIVEPAGMTNKAFRKNPIVPWGHSMDLLPLGASLDERIIKGTHIEADMVFDLDNDPTGFARAVQGKVDKKHLSASSIRYNPFDYDPIMEKVDLKNGGTDEVWTGGFHFKEWELLEWSIVTVPANPEAVRKAYDVLSKREPEDDLEERIRVAMEKLVPDLAEMRRLATSLKELVDQFENDPMSVVQKQVAEALEIERATDVFRDLESHISGGKE